VADAFASMIGRSTYRNSLSAEAALEEFGRKAGLQFDPVCVEAHSRPT
jgi:HD-GYP domain-containing protein (c-di-GMP phosphodiesterase class II)